MTTTRVETNAYENSHGRLPRGRGDWAFSFDTGGGKWTEPVWINGLYGAAKKEAQRRAKAANASAVKVLP